MIVAVFAFNLGAYLGAGLMFTHSTKSMEGGPESLVDKAFICLFWPVILAVTEYRE